MVSRPSWRTIRALTGALAMNACGGAHATTPAPAIPSAEARTEAGFEAVAFLVGDWEGTSADGRIDEHWIAPRGGVMLGVAREVASSGAPTFFELLRIERRASGLVLVPQPRGGPGHDFALSSASDRSVVFENAGDDRVARIGYAIRGDELVARVEYREGRVEEIRMRRASRCP